MPEKPYIMEMPNSKIPEAKEPKMKYFIPASLAFNESLFIAARRYRYFGRRASCLVPKAEFRGKFLG